MSIVTGTHYETTPFVHVDGEPVNYAEYIKGGESPERADVPLVAPGKGNATVEKCPRRLPCV